jgi:hypothetical protein
MRAPKLTHEERCWVVRERLNRGGPVAQDWSPSDFREWILDCMALLEGDVGPLTRNERERVVCWRSLDP